MYVRITKGVGWNKGMEGEIFRVLPPDKFSKVTQFKGIYPVEHPDNTDQGVKVIKKHNCEIVEDEEAMKLSNLNVLEKLASVIGTSVEELVSALKNTPDIEVMKNEDFQPPKLSERELVVRYAKQFLEDLKCEGKDDEGFSWEYRANRHSKGFYHAGSGAAYNAQFVVNAEKRTVVCLLKSYYDNNVARRGIAKCMPEDCFNEHIGKAIALAKALKEDIPTQLTHSPQPEGFEVGDIVKSSINGSYLWRITKITDKNYFESEVFRVLYGGSLGELGKKHANCDFGNCEVADDSSRYR